MASDTSIQSPYTLARLPHPVTDGFKGRLLAASVLSGSKKRKRPEVAVGIDGEGVNIYEIQSPKLMTSYALPPQSAFTCAPCSFRWKSKTSSVRRTTYVSIANPAPRILCFSETAKKECSRAGSFIDANTITLHRDVNLLESPIIHLDILPSGNEPESDADVFAVHENGTARCLSADLSKEYWCASVLSTSSADSIEDDPQEGFVVEYVAATDVVTARKGLLKGREDALSFLTLDANAGGQATSILCSITRPSDNTPLGTMGRSVHVLSTQPSISNDPLGSRRRPQALLTLRLPFAALRTEMPVGKAQFMLHPSSGTLYQVDNGNLTVYDLSGAVPKILSQLSLDTSGPVSVLRISRAIVLSASPASIDLYNIRHRSLQASLPTTEIPPSSLPSKKRKFTQPSSSGFCEQITLISYFADAGLVIGLAGLELVAIRVTLPSDSVGSGRRKGDGLLISAIGRGISSSRNTVDTKSISDALPRVLGKYHPGYTISDERRMEQLIVNMDRYAQRGDLENFEKVFAKEVDIRRDESNLESWRIRREAWEKEHGTDRGNKAKRAELVNGLGRHGSETPGTPTLDESRSIKFPEERPLPQWEWPKKFGAGGLVDPRLVTYVLGKMFSWNDGHQAFTNGEIGSGEHVKSELSIVLYAPNVFRWLVESGNFSLSTLERSIRQTTPRGNSLMGLPTGKFVSALAEFDPEMILLLYILRSPVYLGVGELLFALKFLMLSLEFTIAGAQPTPQQIANRETFNSPITNGNSAMALRLEEDAAERDLDLALSVLETGPAVREEALTAVLTRLHSFPSATTAKALRKELSGTEILSLVQLLRNELSRGGWTSSYLDEDMRDFDEEQQGPTERGIHLISDLLSCALDSFGPGGWLLSATSSGDSHDSMEDLVATLRLEVSAALECIEEATYLNGLLGEMMRHEKCLANATLNLSGKSSKSKSRKIKVPSQLTDGHLLPLGPRPDISASLFTRVGAGGEIRGRSVRDRENLISKTVGKYGFERIKII
ncbi:MAG: hypothetical protein M1839_004064 [Geoglossum umbratile]|nr:MAG: hypothetical protein M1839_004064 [Geoglossum umbratile]